MIIRGRTACNCCSPILTNNNEVQIMTIIDMLAEMCENYLIQTLESEEQTNECDDAARIESISE